MYMGVDDRVFVPPSDVYMVMSTFVLPMGCLCLHRVTCLYACRFMTPEDLNICLNVCRFMTPEDLNICLNVYRFMTPEDLNTCLNVCRFMTSEDLNICLNVCRFMTPEDLNICLNAFGGVSVCRRHDARDGVFVPPPGIRQQFTS
ncbi:hypothetical protein Taro_004685 [Colocasia esculenta]|uniref:Uncharacterized protein n=1 Tax=Colocasia esculenta TaxID=4460 RepID=A0A843TKU1_COLES|nr:hypothetical protein [Colocasia esculenta]